MRRGHVFLLLAFAALAFGCDDAAPGDAGPATIDAGTPDAGAPDAGAPDAGQPRPSPPATLSEAGLFESGVSGPYADGVRPYDVRFPLWTDDLTKRRSLWLPPGTSIDTSDPDHWAFPEGTRIFKELLLADRPIETRLLWKAGPGTGDWVYVSYVYRADGSDADPTPSGAVDALGTFHDVPDTDGCRNCHQGGGDFTLGLGAMQLDRATFDVWIADGILPPDAPFAEPPGDATQAAALGYLHGNCGHCHGALHPLAAQRTMRLRLPVGVTDPFAAPAWVTTLGLAAHHDIAGTTMLVVGRAPEMSQLYVRMGLRGDTAMPPLGTERVDDAGRAAVAAWINGD